jgi:glycosyltransferase involved in cell wall biosynthesis
MRYNATVMIPAFNAERFLPEAIQSAINQTFTGKYEILIVNDGSTDATPRIVKEFSRKHKNIILLNQKNKGISFTRNKLLEESRGEILFGLDADDRLLPEAIEKVMGSYNKNPETGFVYTDQECINQHGEILYKGHKAQCHKYYEDLIYFTQIIGHLRTFKKEKIKDFKFDESLETGEDWDFLLNINPHIKKEHLPLILYSYRINLEGISRKTNKRAKRNRSIKILEKYIRKNNIYPNAEKIKIIPIYDGEHGIYYEHVIDGIKTFNPLAKKVMGDYFKLYKTPLNQENDKEI